MSLDKHVLNNYYYFRIICCFAGTQVYTRYTPVFVSRLCVLHNFFFSTVNNKLLINS
jgi:hypothetical protein